MLVPSRPSLRPRFHPPPRFLTSLLSSRRTTRRSQHVPRPPKCPLDMEGLPLAQKRIWHF
jgi:hypothetical protein